MEKRHMITKLRSRNAERYGGVFAALAAAALIAGCGSGAAGPPSTSTIPAASGTVQSTPSPPPELTTLTVKTSTQPAGSIRVVMSMNNDFQFSPRALNVKAGTLVLFLVNADDSYTHNFVIEDQSGHKLGLSSILEPGTSAVFTVSGLAAGNYKTVCSVDDHVASGMVGILIVT
jgi:plastocyanin